MARLGRLSAFFIFCAVLAPGISRALSIPSKPDGYVTDKAGLLSAAGKTQIETALRKFEEETSNQVVLATFLSLEGGSLEDFSIRLAQQWKPGQKDRDNGVIFLVFKDDRKMRIEVGYGLEGVLTDALSSSIIRGIAAPNFKEGNYEKGIRESLDAIMLATKGEYQPLPVRSKEDELGFWFGLFLMIFVFISVSDFVRYTGYAIQRRRYKQRFGFLDWWLHFSWLYALTKSSGGGSWSSGGSSSGGGGFSGGGGSFGGGGSSGGW